MAEKLMSPVLPSVSADEVRVQLQRIIASPPFRHSRRCQSLLAYVVETACEGRLDELKERVVGSAVFGREADYDTNQDAVVRNAAAEVRKRLAQYYLDPAHEHELRIDLPPGSYLPEFRPAVRTDAAPPTGRRTRLLSILAALGVVAAAATMISLSASKRAAPVASTELDQFWAPLTSAGAPVQMCIGQSRFAYYAGQPRPGTMISPSELAPMRDRFLWFGDAISMSRISGYLQLKGQEMRYRGALTTSYAELRGNPVVLIGAFNNEWTMRLTEGLRFSLAHEGDTGVVRDSALPDGRPWKVSKRDDSWDGEEDYAIVTRIFDPSMERWVVAAGGITHFGTMMAGDFLSRPEYFRQALTSAPRDWFERNMQIVLHTKVVEGTPGPPKVLYTHVW